MLWHIGPRNRDPLPEAFLIQVRTSDLADRGVGTRINIHEAVLRGRNLRLGAERIAFSRFEIVKGLRYGIALVVDGGLQVAIWSVDIRIAKGDETYR